MKRTAFTLIELLAVLAIISFLVSIVFVNSRLFVDRARDAKVKKQLDALRQSVFIFRADHQGRNPVAPGELYPAYIREINLTWQGSRGEGLISYDPAEGEFLLVLERGESVDNLGMAYAEY
ncbi:MAG: type II secretion system protein [Candidatus Wallbacteria bacterium]|nr:type II secretion system protein [Candidatus Wallbacteria bacterium]